jgi:hypothetical protein
MPVTLNLKPEVEAGLAAHAKATGMTIEAYLQLLVERALCVSAVETEQQEGIGMVWENGLLIYGAGSTLPPGIVDDAIQRSRAERSQHLTGHDN